MSNKETGGPAFPVHPDMAAQLNCIPSQSDAGMTLRDYFAAKAINAILNANMVNRIDMEWKTIANEAYWCADAMLKAREQ